MTREEAEKYWPLIKAFSEGREIQWKGIGTGNWYDCKGCAAFSFI